jgi:hypothetical protein
MLFGGNCDWLCCLGEIMIGYAVWGNYDWLCFFGKIVIGYAGWGKL